MLLQKSVVAPFSIWVRNKIEGVTYFPHAQNARFLEPMTVSEYLFAAAMTVLIVWLVAEVSGEDPFKL
jgi:hypothetical protein